MTLKHSFVSPVTDDGDAGLVSPDDWNADHSIVTDLSPDTNDGATLGTTSKKWSDLYLATGGRVYFKTGSFPTYIQDNTDTTNGCLFVVEGGHLGAWAILSAPNVFGFNLRNTAVLSWDSSSTPGALTADTFLKRGGAAATIQQGAPDAAVPVAQTTQVQSASGVSDTPGVDWTWIASKGTGTGVGGSFVWKTSPAGTSGSSQNSAVQQASLDCNGLYTLTDFFQWGGGKRSSADFSKTNDTALANVTDLSVNVRAGRTYSFRAVLFVSSGASFGGVKAAIAGTATATNIIYSGHSKDTGGTGTHGYAQASSLGGAIASSTTTSDTTTIYIDGTITVNAAGTLTVQAAQNTSNGTTTVFARGSYFHVYDMP